MLRLQDIKKVYNIGDEAVHALRGISLSLRKAEFVSILGPSGCGKTTLMNIVGGLDKSTEGEIFIDGVSTKGYKDNDWDNYRNKKIGFVFQSYYLIPHQSVLGNVELAMTMAGVSKEERTRRAKEALIRVGLEDKITKRPNQLSGGQQQRVAIARALVNSPEIILADEPTGALDTQTSEQILDLLKDISKEKLVIMVTHNPELAEHYSTRIINMRDGEIFGDSDPYYEEEEKAESVAFAYGAAEDENQTVTLEKPLKTRKKKSSMSFLTAFKLSMRNLFSKKGRTALISLAGSIGIIGIALILALSNGMTNYITKVQADALSSSPINIGTNAIDVSSIVDGISGMSGNQINKGDKYPSGDSVNIEPDSQTSISRKNKITQDYIDYINANVKSEWVNDIVYSTGVDMPIYVQPKGQTVYSKVGSAVSELLRLDLIKNQYDVLAGKMPESKNDVVLVVDEYNYLKNSTLAALGIITSEDKGKISFNDILGKEYKVLTSDELYVKNGTRFDKVNALDIDFGQSETIRISGIIRVKSGTESGSASSGIGYTKDLTDWLLTVNAGSEIVDYMLNNVNVNPLTGTPYIEYTNPYTGPVTAEEQYDEQLRKVGGKSMPNSINIYPVDFSAKDEIKKVLNAYNTGKADADQILYTDYSEMAGSVITQMVNVITYVLIAFTAVSLLVSCVMIAIITYISVIERTKEIGILRSIGARKKDIKRIFNAETVIIGLCAGIIGVLVALILTIPINLIVNALAGIGTIASLSWVAALVLIVISVVLTLVSGLIPASIAAKKDPVKALRTE